MTQKKDNKGFSLVELIVVVAIMAVLMGILVPTLVKNVEKSKQQKDASGIEEIRSTMQLCLADEDYSAITTKLKNTSGGKIEITKLTNGSPLSNEETDYLAEVSDQIKDYTCKSKEYKSAIVTFIIEEEAVYYEVTGTKSGKTIYSENYPASSNNGGSSN